MIGSIREAIESGKETVPDRCGGHRTGSGSRSAGATIGSSREAIESGRETVPNRRDRIGQGNCTKSSRLNRARKQYQIVAEVIARVPILVQQRDDRAGAA
jgi:hypothetical protein